MNLTPTYRVWGSAAYHHVWLPILFFVSNISTYFWGAPAEGGKKESIYSILYGMFALKEKEVPIF